MGWERKRGKIEEFNRLLRGATDTSFHHVVGDRSVLRSIRYCLTLDSDTRLPRDAARELVGIILHPAQPAGSRSGAAARDAGLRHPAAARQRDDVERGRIAVRARLRRPHRRRPVHHGRVRRLPGPVRRGHLRRQGPLPRRRVHGARSRAACPRTRCCRTTCSRACTRAPHWSATSNWSTTTRRRCWRTCAVSGDGCAATGRSCCGCSRTCRRAQGMARNQLPFISRWKILDNLRRSLMAPALLAFLLAGWTFLPGRPVVWTAMALGVTGSATLLAMARLLAMPWYGHSFGVFLRGVSDDIQTAAAQALLSLMLLPFHAWEMVRAIILTLARLAVTHRRLLEWETASSVAAASAGLRGRAALRVFLVEMASSPLVALLAIAGVAASPHGAVDRRACPSCSRGWPRRSSRGRSASHGAPRQRALAPHERTPGAPPGAEDLALLRGLRRPRRPLAAARQLPGGARTPAGAAHVADQHRHGPARRRWPHDDLGFIDDRELIERIDHTLDTCEVLERHEGHLLNWYDTSTLAPLWPRYVSTVDSGNLVTALITLASGLESLAMRRDGEPPLREGLADTAVDRSRLRLRQCGGITPPWSPCTSGSTRSRPPSSPTCSPTRTTRCCRPVPRPTSRRWTTCWRSPTCSRPSTATRRSC